MKLNLLRFHSNEVSARFDLSTGAYILATAVRRRADESAARPVHGASLHVMDANGALIARERFELPIDLNCKLILKALTARADRFAALYFEALRRIH